MHSGFSHQHPAIPFTRRAIYTQREDTHRKKVIKEQSISVSSTALSTVFYVSFPYVLHRRKSRRDEIRPPFCSLYPQLAHSAYHRNNSRTSFPLRRVYTLCTIDSVDFKALYEPSNKITSAISGFNCRASGNSAMLALVSYETRTVIHELRISFRTWIPRSVRSRFVLDKHIKFTVFESYMFEDLGDFSEMIS